VNCFKYILVLLNLERLVGVGTSNNLVNVFLNSLLAYGGFITWEIINKLICFGCDGVVFIGIHNGVTT
jgi:hypothetical protein